MPSVLETVDAAASTATTYTLTPGQTAQGQLTGGSDSHDWFRVNLVAGQTYTFAEVGTGTNGVQDTFLRLYASDGTTLLASNDDGLPNHNSLFTYTATTTGTYYMDAGTFNNAYSGQYGVSVTQGTKASFDLQMGSGVIDTNFSWSAPGAPATVTYGFRQSAAPYTVAGSNIATFSQVTAAEMAAVQAVLQLWSDVANITFTQVNPGGYTDNATILYSNYSDANDGAGAFAFYPGSTASADPAGDVWLNTSVSRTSLPFGSYSFETILHETGHAIGLSHPGLYNAALGVSITYANNAEFIQDTNQYSVMSYFDEGNTGANFNGYPATPMLYDIYAAQQIYGANMTTRTGDTVYGFGSNAGSVYDFALYPQAAVCIWDAGGNDTINCSNFTQTELINLNAGTFSNIGGLTSNLSIAFGATIENAIGGSGADTIIGNSANNTIDGRGGNDSMMGGAGDDTYYVGSAGDLVIENPGEGNDTIHATVDHTLEANVESIVLEGSGNINAVGNSAGNYLQGNSGNNVLDGGGGIDLMAGGAGDDVYYVDNSGDVLLENPGEGTDVVHASFDYTIGANVESVILEGSGNINAVGNSAGNYLRGNSGNNVLDGGGGIDLMAGGAGDDVYYVDNSGDVLLENPGEGTDVVHASFDYTIGANVESVILEGSGNINAVGNSAGNYLRGNSGNNVLDGGGGIDLMAGGAGDDVYYVDNSGDVVLENPGEGTDVVHATVRLHDRGQRGVGDPGGQR